MKTHYNKNIMPYKLPKYIIYNILPKCNIIYGESISSVYLQLLLNINHKKNSKEWQIDKCWMQPNTIAKNLGYNVRTIYKNLNILQELELISIEKKGKLNLYCVENYNLNDIEEINKFNEKIKFNLLKYVDDINSIKWFENIDNKIYDDYLWIQDLVLLKQLLLNSEKMYKGSSLFFIHNFAISNINYVKNKKRTYIKRFSEEEMGNLCGVSQSTISRYISTMADNDFLKIDKNIVNKPMKIKLNIIKQKNKGVEKMENTNLSCPICGKKLIEEKSLNLHIARSKDEKHKLLNKLRKENLKSNINDIYENNIESFNQIKVVEPEVKENKINTTELVRYFYTIVGDSCKNWAKECTQVKNLIKSGCTVEDVKLTMDYLAKQGNFDLRFLNRSVTDAKLFYSYINDLNKNGTEAYLVNYFYSKLNVKVNEQTLINDVRKIKQTINSGSSYEETKRILDYMVSAKCTNINFIGNMKTQALLKMSNVNYGNNNPCFNDRTEYDIIRESLINGNYNIKKEIDQNKSSKLKEIAKDIFEKQEYSKKYNPFEWAYKIGLELDKDMYDLAKNRITNYFAVDELINRKTIPQTKKEALINFKDRLINWIENYDKKYC